MIINVNPERKTGYFWRVYTNSPYGFVLDWVCWTEEEARAKTLGNYPNLTIIKVEKHYEVTNQMAFLYNSDGSIH